MVMRSNGRFCSGILTILVWLALAITSSHSALAQEPGHRPDQSDYARAELFMPWKTEGLVHNSTVRPNWLAGDSFWYRNSVPGGQEYILYDVRARTRARLFDHDRLATSLGALLDTVFEPLALSFTSLDLDTDRQRIDLEMQSHHLRCELRSYRCEVMEPSRVAGARGADRNIVVSPDGRLGAFRRDHDLWVRDLETGRETQLTTDGVEDYGYATDSQGWARSERPILIWSPDSRSIATYRQDERGVGEMYLIESQVGHPRLQRWKYPLPGDTVVPMLERLIIHVGNAAGGSGDAPRIVMLQTPPDHHRSTVCDGIDCGAGLVDVEWSADSRKLAFVSTSRDYHDVELRIADAETGAVRTILHESVPTFFESTLTGRRQNWRILDQTNEVVWFSQRDDWGHLYLYDLESGKLLHQITSGAWNVDELLHLDSRGRALYFTGVGREAGRDPYFRHLYRVGLDGKGLRLLTPEDADHLVTFAPSGKHFLDTYSRPDLPPVTLLRPVAGGQATTIEEADISSLLANGWVPPIPITVKARDGKTDLYGLLFRPSNFDETKRYPIINNIYPGPQVGSVRSRSFSASRRDVQALAELGFIVVQIDAMGTPLRSKTFHAAAYGDMGDNGLPDQIAGMKELAERYPWIDLDRVGIYGHSGGGFASTAALLRYPDFFHVAVSSAGNHDNRLYSYHWGEKWHGLLVPGQDGTDNYDSQANHLMAENLRGKLLITHGSADDNVSPDNTMVLVDALIRANKDFDMIIFPNRNHGFTLEEYMVRRRWDYFVRHLHGVEPPHEFRFHQTTRQP